MKKIKKLWGWCTYMTSWDKKIAIIIPAYNEELTIKQVILDFKNHIPEAEIFVIDNNSTDATNKLAEEEARVLFEPKQGKSNAIKKAFREIDADIYVMVDGDSTYFAEDVHKLLQPVLDGRADVVVGDRVNYQTENKRLFHNFGNVLVRNLINKLFGVNLKDIMSGYRALSKNFVKNYSILVEGFELETDITLQAINKNFTIVEVPVRYKDRPLESPSKLNTFHDGFLVLRRIFTIFKNYKPLLFFGVIGVILFIAALACGIPVFLEFVKTRYITHVPLSILSTGLMLVSFLSFFTGIILDVILQMFQDLREVINNK